MKSQNVLLKALKILQKIAKKNNSNIIEANQIERSSKELLIKSGYLKEIIKGWYLITKLNEDSNSSTIWYANFWDFLKVYLNSRFKNNYCLSAENSLDLHTNSTVIPKKVIVIVSHGGSGKCLNLLFNTSILIYADPKSIPDEIYDLNGLQIMSLPYALCKVSPSYFLTNASDAEIALRELKDSSKISKIIIQSNLKSAASRIVGAYLFIKNEQMANKIQKDLNLYGIYIKPQNPFEIKAPLLSEMKQISSHIDKIFSLWKNYRNEIINIFSRIKIKKNIFLEKIEDLYVQDAFNSLSLEGYKVNQKLIEETTTKKFISNEYNALAAKGYFVAFQEVKKSIKKIINGRNPGEVFQEDLQNWYQALFSSSVEAQIIPKERLLGYRNIPVYIKNSRHIPPSKDVLLDAMDALFSCLKNEPDAAVRAVLGHYIFVYIHPYIDGNGRIARFLMNTMFVSGNYTWNIIRLKNRNEYMTSLEIADINHDIKPFAKFIKSEMMNQ